MQKPKGFVFNVIGRSIEIKLTRKCVEACVHQGDCQEDVEFWVRQLRPYLDRIPADIIAGVLEPYGDYSEEDLKDHEQNLVRLLWIAAGDCSENKHDSDWNSRRHWLWTYMEPC